jgi:hypothetical protein
MKRKKAEKILMDNFGPITGLFILELLFPEYYGRGKGKKVKIK